MKKHSHHHRRRCPPHICWRSLAFYLTLGLVLTFGAAAHADLIEQQCYIDQAGERQCYDTWGSPRTPVEKKCFTKVSAWERRYYAQNPTGNMGSWAFTEKLKECIRSAK